MLHVVTWLWGSAYGEHYVRHLAAAVGRNLNEAHRFLALTDRPRFGLGEGVAQYGIQDIGLTKIKGCIARLRLFDPAYQRDLGIKEGDKVLSLDLDLVVTGALDALVTRPEGFSILQGINSNNLCPFNGSVWMLRAGYRPDVWTSFSMDAVNKIPRHEYPDDQGWLYHMMPDAGAYGPSCGVYGFKKLHWPSGDALPDGAKVVAFPGWRDPAKFAHIDWIREHWR